MQRRGARAPVRVTGMRQTEKCAIQFHAGLVTIHNECKSAQRLRKGGVL